MHSATKLGLITIIFIQLVLSVILWVRPEWYDFISREDELAENLTAIMLAISGFVLLYQPFRMKINISRWSVGLLIVVGLGFLLAAGEEISWGQRIFGFETPPALEEINDQNEFNFHNIEKKFFDRILDRLSIVFFFLSTMLLLFKKKKVFDFPVPDPYIILMFVLMVFYRQNINQVFDFYNFFGYLVILLLLLCGMKIHDRELVGYTVLVLLSTIALSYWHSKYSILFQDHNNSANEFREYFFAFCTLHYAFFIKREQC